MNYLKHTQRARRNCKELKEKGIFKSEECRGARTSSKGPQLVLAGVAQLIIQHHPVDQKVAGLIPGRGTYMRDVSHINACLSLSPHPFPVSLLKSNEKMSSVEDKKENGSKLALWKSQKKKDK